MKFNPLIHHRRSIRLKEYDYGQSGLYFITICVQDQLCLFADIIDTNKDLCVCPDNKCDCQLHSIKVNIAGNMIERWYYELENKFQNLKCNEMVVMPNHFHCIMEINTTDLGSLIESESKESDAVQFKTFNYNLTDVIQWFKTMTTNTYIKSVKELDWPKFNGRLWQRNYYEHIIRNEKSYIKISDYINSNPLNWITDKHYKL